MNEKYGVDKFPSFLIFNKSMKREPAILSCDYTIKSFEQSLERVENFLEKVETKNTFSEKAMVYLNEPIFTSRSSILKILRTAVQEDLYFVEDLQWYELNVHSFRYSFYSKSECIVLIEKMEAFRKRFPQSRYLADLKFYFGKIHFFGKGLDKEKGKELIQTFIKDYPGNHRQKEAIIWLK